MDADEIFRARVIFRERGDWQSRGIRREDHIGTNDGLRFLRCLALDGTVFEHRLDDEIAALQRRIIVRGIDAVEQRVAIGRFGAALHDLAGDQLVRIFLALVGARLVAIDKDHIHAGLRRHVSDARTHETGAEHADLADVRRRHVLRPPRSFVEFAH